MQNFNPKKFCTHTIFEHFAARLSLLCVCACVLCVFSASAYVFNFSCIFVVLFLQIDSLSSITVLCVSKQITYRVLGLSDMKCHFQVI